MSVDENLRYNTAKVFFNPLAYFERTRNYSSKRQNFQQQKVNYLPPVRRPSCSPTNEQNMHCKPGVTLTGRNMTGPPCSDGHPTAHAPGRRCADRPRARRPARPPAGNVTDDDRRRQTPASKTILAH